MLLFRIGQGCLIQMESLAFYELLFMSGLRYCFFCYLTNTYLEGEPGMKQVFFPFEISIIVGHKTGP